MKVCKVCLESNILCPACNKKKDTGIVSEDEIKLMRAVHKISKEMKKEIDFEKAVDTEDYIIIVSKQPNFLIGPGGRNAKKLSDEMGKKVIVIDSKDDERTAIGKIINAHVQGINISYGKEESYKIRLNKREKNIGKDKLKALEKFLGKKAEIVFE